MIATIWHADDADVDGGETHKQLSKLRQDVPCILAMLRELQESGEPRAEEVERSSDLRIGFLNDVRGARGRWAVAVCAGFLMGDQDEELTEAHLRHP